MKKRGVSLFLTLIVFWAITGLCCNVEGRTVEADDEFRLQSKAAVLIEPITETMLLERNADERFPPASLTKIMTLYLTFEALRKGTVRLNDYVWISKRAWKTGGSKMFVEVGDRVLLEDLIKGIAVDSGNDACVAVAEYVGGSVEAFVRMMNEKAKELGLSNTHYVNPHGLDDLDQYTTARDVARLASLYITRFPEALKYHSMTEFTYNGIRQYNRNRLLLRDPTVDGLKTGYVSRGGYHLVATAKRDGIRLIAVVLGAKKPRIREQDAYSLLTYGFRHYTLVRPLNSERPVGVVKVWKANIESIEVFPEKSVSVVLGKEEANNVVKKVNLPEEITAPVKKGSRVGSVSIVLGNKVVAEVPLVVRSEIELAPFYKRILQSFAKRLRIFQILLSNRGIRLAVVFPVVALVVLWVVRKRRKRRRRNFTKIRYF
ncbi:MAG: D-alanyl-D-alanine carboxypeptidase [Deltaproteobacteria bacterium]|nr:D-alanyl-D-alanine carboxypeptidase [Deltaproteobacteria bacterium]MBW2067293.1 D-alanyl-D-alanine carboxypeptidase [Deltaproteobacteria bacterium]